MILHRWRSCRRRPPSTGRTARQLGIKSNLTAPALVGGESPIGALAFNTVRTRARLAGRAGEAAAAGRAGLHQRARPQAPRARPAGERRAPGAGGGLRRGGALDARLRDRCLLGHGADSGDLRVLAGRADRHGALRGVGASRRLGPRPGSHRAPARTGEPVGVEYRIVLPGDGPACAGSPRAVGLTGRPRRSRTASRASPSTSPSASARRGASREPGASRRRRRARRPRVLRGGLRRALRLLRLPAARPARTSPGAEQGLQTVEFFLERIHADDRPRFFELRDQLHDGRLEQAHRRVPLPAPGRAGSGGCSTWRASPRATLRTRVRGAYGVIRDITERRQREDELRRSLEEIERLKDRLQAESDYLKAEISESHAQGEITGPERRHPEGPAAVEQVGADRLLRARAGETGTRQGARRPGDPPAEPARGPPDGQGQLRRAADRPHRERAVRPREGRLHRGPDAPGRALRGRRRRDPLPRRDRRAAARAAGEAAARAARRASSSGSAARGRSRSTCASIAATNRDLAEEVRKGRFREDLYYRLNVFPIRVPPLRERAEDIPLLVWAFLEEFSARMGKKITQVPRKTMEALQRHAWPGNVRELRNVIEHGAILTTGDTLLGCRRSTTSRRRGAAADAGRRRTRAHRARARGRAGTSRGRRARPRRSASTRRRSTAG